MKPRLPPNVGDYKPGQIVRLFPGESLTSVDAGSLVTYSDTRRLELPREQHLAERDQYQPRRWPWLLFILAGGIAIGYGLAHL